ncbi:hypothetical protein [Thermomonas sp.]|uniref:hypothetical protein n=1 Tax=Thermomonas sp. TaxID=1971895 RepID=UPI0024896492|nr:hypothetical protein [Thermomonas sp.]MDI1253852.1 hypothetical protein [Thermomonas sp.]
MTAGSIRTPVNLVALGTALSVTLVVIYVVCALAAMALPKAPLAHGWLQLFSTAPVGSLESLATGIAGSLAFAWLSAAIFTPIYNRLVAN